MQAEEVREYWESNAGTWTRHSRAGFDIFRDALNTPAFLGMLPEITGLKGLDIGCGEGEHTRQLARVKLICEAGLIIEEFGEPRASETLAREMPTLAPTRAVPVFLHVRAKKPD